MSILRRAFLEHALWGAVAATVMKRSASAGTYGDASRDFAGFTASINASVGNMSDHERETKLYEERLDASEKQLDGAKPRLEQMLRHYREGNHPHTRLRGRLLKTKPTSGELCRMELRLPGHQTLSARDMELNLYIDPQLAKPLRVKLMMEFALSQLSPGGVFAQLPPSTDARTLSDTQSMMAGYPPQVNGGDALVYHCAIRMLLAREQEAHVRKLAARSEPAPAAQPWEKELAPLGHIAAKAMVRSLDRQPLGDEWAALFKSISPAHAERAALLLLLSLRDDEWPEKLEPFRRAVQPLLPGSALLQRYLDALK